MLARNKRAAANVMAGTTITTDGLPWETWDDPELAARSAVRWKLFFSGPRTPTASMSMGLGEIAPGGVLLLHHHATPEIYHILEGEGLCEVDGAAHELRAGVALFIPAEARHRTTNAGAAPLRFLLVFPTDSFEQVAYRFDE